MSMPDWFNVLPGDGGDIQFQERPKKEWKHGKIFHKNPRSFAKKDYQICKISTNIKSICFPSEGEGVSWGKTLFEKVQATQKWTKMEISEMRKAWSEKLSWAQHYVKYITKANLEITFRRQNANVLSCQCKNDAITNTNKDVWVRVEMQTGIIFLSFLAGVNRQYVKFKNKNKK